MIRFSLLLCLLATSALVGCVNDVATDDDDDTAPAAAVETDSVGTASATRPGQTPCARPGSPYTCPKPSK